MDTAAQQLNFTTIDTVIVIVYFVAVLAIGLWISRNTKTGDDLFLAGRSLGWIAIGFSPYLKPGTGICPGFRPTFPPTLNPDFHINL